MAVSVCLSMAGNREKDWGKEKVFREGQAEQVLDTLFFDFIDLAKKLQPKVVIAENVKGLLLGEAKNYVRQIYREFDLEGVCGEEDYFDSEDGSQYTDAADRFVRTAGVYSEAEHCGGCDRGRGIFAAHVAGDSCVLRRIKSTYGQGCEVRRVEAHLLCFSIVS